MARFKQSADDFREEARQLTASAERVHPSKAEGYYQAAGRCSRIATLMDRGLTLDEAVDRVMGSTIAVAQRRWAADERSHEGRVS
jgi:hypothetical protein